MNTTDMRSHPRTLVRAGVDVNGGAPYQGGMLYDMSVGGASVTYSKAMLPETDDPLVIGQNLVLVVNGDIRFPSIVVRIFDGGFATQFDFSLSL